MSGYSANSENVKFDYYNALQAARELHELAGIVYSKQDARAEEGRLVVEGWEGGHRTTFDEKMIRQGGDAEEVRGALVSLAGTFASAWAQAWGEQDRINHARYVQHEKDDDNWVEDGTELVVGEDDYGAPPDDPPTPNPLEYEVTRQPMKPEFENSATPRGSGPPSLSV